MRSYDDVRIICAEAAHETNRVWCRTLGDTSQAVWDLAEPWQRESALKGVDGIFAGNGAGASHASWLREKEATGWKFGLVKNVAAKEHPCMVAFDKLPAAEQEKDYLFVKTVTMFAHALGYEGGNGIPLTIRP